jgi:hypothetical protein
MGIRRPVVFPLLLVLVLQESLPAWLCAHGICAGMAESQDHIPLLLAYRHDQALYTGSDWCYVHLCAVSVLQHNRFQLIELLLAWSLLAVLFVHQSD